jgi:hypothetical protein
VPIIPLTILVLQVFWSEVFRACANKLESGKRVQDATKSKGLWGDVS